MQTEIETTEKHMQALKALAQVTLDISEARNELNKLEEHETEYLVSRENKVIERIKGALEKSKSLVEETNKNYEEIVSMTQLISKGVTLLTKANETFTHLIEEKDKKYREWENDLFNQETTIESLQKANKIEATGLQSLKSQLDKQEKHIETEHRKLESERGLLNRNIKRFKENKI